MERGCQYNDRESALSTFSSVLNPGFAQTGQKPAVMSACIGEQHTRVLGDWTKDLMVGRCTRCSILGRATHGRARSAKHGTKHNMGFQRFSC